MRRMSKLRIVRRIAALVVGSAVVLVGVVMFFTPGPAILVIPAGLAILATEFAWARKALAYFRAKLARAMPRGGGWWHRLAQKFSAK